MAILDTTLQAAGGAAKGGLKGFGWATLGPAALTGLGLAAAAFAGPLAVGLAAGAVIGGLTGMLGGTRGGLLGFAIGVAAAAAATTVALLTGPVGLGLLALGAVGATAALGATILGPTFSFFGGLFGMGKGAKNAQQQQQEITMDNKRAQLAELTAQNQMRSDYMEAMAMGAAAGAQQQDAGRVAYGPHSARVLQQEQQQQQGMRAPSFIP
ncbi:MAG TPA: hypothetical protein VFT64_00335 [Rickettsiales bacterium]|nr:hypothetical protein [Rickettsiales bacterium]